MSATIWLPYTGTYRHDKWVTKDLKIVECPELEESGSGRRVRLKGAKKSFPASRLGEHLAEAIDPWFSIPPNPAKPEATMNLHNLNQPVYETIIGATLVWAADGLPELQVRQKLNAYHRYSYYLDVSHAGPISTRQYTVNGENPYNSQDTAPSRRELAKAAFERLKEMGDAEVVATTPQGQQIRLELTPESRRLLQDLLDQISAWYDAGSNLDQVMETYKAFRLALAGAGLVLPSMNEDEMATLLNGGDLVYTTDNEVEANVSISLAYHPGKGRFLAHAESHVSPQALSEWEIAQQIAEYTGRADDFSQFLKEHAEQVALAHVKGNK